MRKIMSQTYPLPEAIYYAPERSRVKRNKLTSAILLAWFMAFIVSIIVLTAASVTAPAAASTQVPITSPTAANTFYLEKVNALRAQNGLAPVRLLIELNESSNDKASVMAANHYWGHYDPDGKAFSDYIWKRVPPATLVGENLARCYPTRNQAYAALDASPTHHEIMVGNFNFMGVSEAYDSSLGCTITVMHFARI